VSYRCAQCGKPGEAHQGGDPSGWYRWSPGDGSAYTFALMRPGGVGPTFLSRPVTVPLCSLDCVERRRERNPDGHVVSRGGAP
jgi:hypothetical protein